MDRNAEDKASEGRKACPTSLPSMGNIRTHRVRPVPGCLHRGAFARYSAFNTQISDKLLVWPSTEFGHAGVMESIVGHFSGP
jgi:hypothetical protein